MNGYLGKGVSFPFSFDPTGGVAVSDEKKRIEGSILQILWTRRGERFMRPDFGSRLPELVFEENDQVLKGLIRHDVVEALRKWEKRVVVTGVDFVDTGQEKNRNSFNVRISYQIVQSQVEGNLVFPFYTSSGGNKEKK